jgi:hypothetical protein
VLDATDSRRPRLVRTIAPPFLAHDVVFAPDGERIWVTSGSRGAVAVYGRRGGAHTILPAAAPPQHVAFSATRAYVASGDDGVMRIHRHDGSLLRVVPVPAGSYNVTFGSAESTLGRPTALTPSLDQGIVCLLDPSGSPRLVRHVARSANDACVVEAG